MLIIWSIEPRPGTEILTAVNMPAFDSIKDLRNGHAQLFSHQRVCRLTL
jgi:hypothetical protein